MILLFDMWINNVAYHDGEPSKQFKWSVCQWRRYIVYISRLSAQLEAQEDEHSYFTFNKSVIVLAHLHTHTASSNGRRA